VGPWRNVYGARLLATPRGLRVAIGVVFAVAAVFVATNRAVDVDVWWLAAAGRDTLASGHVPRVNGYSFAAPSEPWVMHEWLLGPFFAIGFGALGPSFSALATLLLVTLAAWLVLGVATREAEDPVRATVFGAATLIVFGTRFLTMRPMGVALLFSIAAAILAFRPRFDMRALLLAVAGELLWANVHGSFPLGVALLAAGAIAEPTDRRMRMAATALAFAVTFVNPYGWHLHALVLRYFAGDGGGIHDFIRTHIAEFLPLWRHRGTVGPIEIVGLFVLGAFAVRALFRAHERVRAAFCLVLFAMALTSVRNFELFGLLTFVLLGARASRSPRPRVVTAWVLVPGVAVALLSHALLRARRAPDDWVAPTLGGPSLARLVSRLPEGARVATTFPAAGRVIWLGAPRRIGVLYDPRNDCYPRSVAEDAFALDAPTISPQDAFAILDRYRVDTLLLPGTSRVALFASAAPGWRIADEDGPFRVIVRAP
jgi:hypothetical protein